MRSLSGSHVNSTISSIDPKRIHESLLNDEIVIVAGFQGEQNDEITVLGRGGSDVTAVALARSLGASSCFIYTDVEGVFTADPNTAPEAELLKTLSHDEMIDISSSGAQVLMQEAVEIAKNAGIDIIVGDSCLKNKGTLISS
jgi:aspartate kinase